jgi:hypothetical protein
MAIHNRRRWQIEAFNSARHLGGVTELLQDSFNTDMSIDKPTLKEIWRTVLDRPGISSHFVVRDVALDVRGNELSLEHGPAKLLGFCATFKIPSQGSLIYCVALLVVRKTHRGLGIGTSLHEAYTRELFSLPSVKRVQYGSFAPHILAGIPLSADDRDKNWFARKNWRITENQLSDLKLNLRSFKAPADVDETAAARSVAFEISPADRFSEIAAFVKRPFGDPPELGLIALYEQLFSAAKDNTWDIMAAIHEQRVVGCIVLFLAKERNAAADETLWAKLAPGTTGGIAGLFVHRE